MASGSPSAVTGFVLAVRLHRLVAAVWLVSMAIIVPVLAVIEAATGPDRANLPSEGLGTGEDLVVFFEIMRPLAVPLAVTFGFGWLVFFAWWVLWHAGTVRWWSSGGADPARLADIIGGGLAVWWRFTRLALIAFIVQMIVSFASWMPLRGGIGGRMVLPLLISGSALTILGTILCCLSALRGAWLLGEPGRRSALVAWARGLWVTLRQPLRSLFSLLVWALPGLLLLVAPLLVDGTAALLLTLVAWLASSFCWVALHLSFAPPKPPPARTVDPLAPPGPYVTTRFPTLFRDD